MGHLFLDIETYSSKENEDSSLNPYMAESKVIVIAYCYYNTFKPPKKEEIKPPIFLNEWESNENTILMKFHGFQDFNKPTPFKEQPEKEATEQTENPKKSKELVNAVTSSNQRI